MLGLDVKNPNSNSLFRNDAHLASLCLLYSQLILPQSGVVKPKWYNQLLGRRSLCSSLITANGETQLPCWIMPSLPVAPHFGFKQWPIIWIFVPSIKSFNEDVILLKVGWKQILYKAIHGNKPFSQFTKLFLCITEPTCGKEITSKFPGTTAFITLYPIVRFSTILSQIPLNQDDGQWGKR